MPIVTIIIPVYNAGNYITQCLDSLLNQSLKEVEIICIDDGSTDCSLMILKEYKTRDSRIVVQCQEHRGAGTARNFALQFAQGKYIVFLDADDFFEREMLLSCVQRMDAEQSDIAVFLARRYDHKTGEYSEMPKSIITACCPGYSPFSPHEVSKHIFNIFQIAPWNKMFRHSFLKRNRLTFQEIPRANDVAFHFQALALAEKISVIQETFANYRVNTGTSLQQTNDKTPLSFWEAFKEAKKRLQDSGFYEEFEQSFLNSVLGNILYNLRSVKNEEAKNIILTYIKNHGEEEYGFLNHPLDYYYNFNKILEYCLIHAELPVVLERIKEHHRKIRKLSLQKDKRIEKLDKDLKSTKRLLKQKDEKIQKIEGNLNKIRQSKSFIIGEKLAWPVRKIRRVLRTK